MSAHFPAPHMPSRQHRSRLLAAALTGLSAWALALCLPVCANAAEPTAAKAAPAATKAPATAKPAAKKSKPKAKMTGTAAELTQMLITKGPSVQDCAVNHGLDKGANSVAIVTKVTINGRGQVINIQTSVNVDKGEGDKVRDCVNELIKSIKFPESAAPMITIERNWTIKST